MSDLNASSGNEDQIEFWNGETGEQWADNSDSQDRMLRPLGRAAIKHARPRSGESALDIGCGCGDTSLDLMTSVGKTGRVMGVDVSKPMTDKARERANALPPELRSRISFEVADASTFEFQPATQDLLFSRFGIMFFHDPVTAFAHMRSALKPRGRLTFVCWRAVADNDWVRLPMSAAFDHVDRPEAQDPTAPGPFAFQDVDYVSNLLTQVGYREVELNPFDPDMIVESKGGPEEAVNFLIDRGPLVRLLKDTPPEVIEKVKQSISETINPHYKNDQVNLKGGCWIVSANNP